MQNEKRSSFFSFILILFGVVIGLAVGALVLWLALGAPLAEAFELWFAISLAGMFGGFLFGIRDRQLVLPHKNKNGTVNPGWLADCLYGVAGAWVVFLVIPGTFNFEDGWEIIKVLATAVIGGYGSRALITQALNETIKKLEDRIDETIEENKVQQEADAKALALVSRHLDKTVAVSDIKPDELKEAIKAASPTVKVQIFYMAHDLRSEYWESNKALMERTMTIFEALIESDPEGKFHRNYGQLGYILKDKVPPDYVRARAALTKAIELRGKRDPVGFRLYELNRAICNILLDPNFQAGMPSTDAIQQIILEDLKAAMAEIKTSNAIKASYQDSEQPEEMAKNPIGKWMKLNGVELEGLR
ncbi:MAG: hypothetical protein Fur0022_09420 [Anaerolineales bacterium]